MKYKRDFTMLLSAMAEMAQDEHVHVDVLEVIDNYLPDSLRPTWRREFVLTVRKGGETLRCNAVLSGNCDEGFYVSWATAEWVWEGGKPSRKTIPPTSGGWGRYCWSAKFDTYGAGSVS